MVKIGSSAHDAQKLGLLSEKARIVMNADRRLYVAKQEVIRLYEEGYSRPARSQLEQLTYDFLQGGLITDYEYYVIGRLAYVMTGGSLSAPTLVSEEYLFELERETFMSLQKKEKTQERIASLITSLQPLRN